MKYMGSKARIAKYIVPIIQQYIEENNITTYIEPFVGGANVIDKIKCMQKIGSDKNQYLIALLKRVRDEKPLYESIPKELYDKARTAFNNGNTSEFEDWQIGNIGFLASYNGRWFDGGYAKSGYEKTKSGLRSDNKSGVIGVRSVGEKFIADIRVNKKLIVLGRFFNKEDAIKARLKAEKEYFGEFAPQQHLYEEYGINNKTK